MANTKATNKKLGWHFLPKDMTLGYADGRKAQVGKTLKYTGTATPQVCYRGMHASHTIADAASFKKGPVLCRVEISGDVSDDGAKMAGRERKVISAKEVTLRDAKQLGKDLKHDGLKNITDEYEIAYELSNAAYDDAPAFNKVMEKWIADGRQVVEVEVKPKLTAEILKAFMGVGIVRTKTELEKAFKGFDIEADDDSYHDDLIEELLEEVDAIEIDGFQKTRNNCFGEAGYVIGRKSR
jgi:hypothetical protein